MKTKKEIKLTPMNVWKFKETYPTICKKHSETILSGINSIGYFLVEAGKEDSLKLTY